MNLVKSKVVLLPCREYDEEKIYMLLKQGLDFLGGVETLIPKDAKILLKPNHRTVYVADPYSALHLRSLRSLPLFSNPLFASLQQ